LARFRFIHIVSAFLFSREFSELPFRPSSVATFVTCSQISAYLFDLFFGVELLPFKAFGRAKVKQVFAETSIYAGQKADARRRAILPAQYRDV